jgi:thiol-disulfide isomerase/thioredoxin
MNETGTTEDAAENAPENATENAAKDATKDATKSAPKRRLAVVAAGSLAGIAIGLAAVYGISSFLGNRGGAPECRAAVETARRLAPLARGEVAGVVVASHPLKLPDLVFQDANGGERRLAQWQGRTVLLNLWATWCVPCRKEMPALDALQNKLGGAPFEVVSINIDTRNPDKPRAWLKEVGVTHLGYYADASAKVFQDLKLVGRAIGMPTTLLVDQRGCEIGTLAGPAEWASEDALKLVRAAIGSSS